MAVVFIAFDLSVYKAGYSIKFLRGLDVLGGIIFEYWIYCSSTVAPEVLGGQDT